jgi:hypothetical protein
MGTAFHYYRFEGKEFSMIDAFNLTFDRSLDYLPPQAFYSLFNKADETQMTLTEFQSLQNQMIEDERIEKTVDDNLISFTYRPLRLSIIMTQEQHEAHPSYVSVSASYTMVSKAEQKMEPTVNINGAFVNHLQDLSALKRIINAQIDVALKEAQKEARSLSERIKTEVEKAKNNAVKQNK